MHESEKLTGQFQDRLRQRTLPCCLTDMSEPWETDTTDITVHATVPFLSGGETQDDTVKQSLILAMIAERSTRSMDPCIHHWINSQVGGQRRDRNADPRVKDRKLHQA